MIKFNLHLLINMNKAKDNVMAHNVCHRLLYYIVIIILFSRNFTYVYMYHIGTILKYIILPSRYVHSNFNISLNIHAYIPHDRYREIDRNNG